MQEELEGNTAEKYSKKKKTISVEDTKKMQEGSNELRVRTQVFPIYQIYWPGLKFYGQIVIFQNKWKNVIFGGKIDSRPSKILPK